MSEGVVMLSPNFHPYIGGAEKQALEVSKALAAGGIPVTVLTRRTPGLRASEIVEDIPVRRVAAWGSGLFNSFVFMISSLLYLLGNSKSYRVIHVHLAGSPALAACAAGLLLGKRVVVKIGGGRGIGEIAVSARSLTGRLKLRLLRLFGPSFVAVTRDLADEMAEHGFVERVRVIPNGVNVDHYQPASPDGKIVLRKALGWPGGLCFLYVGRLAPEKQLDRFIRAFAETASASKALFVLIGGGPEKDKLLAEIEHLGIGDQVRLMPPTDEIAGAYAAADVFVLPSVSEGLSNALLEAMSSGLAVLGSRVGGTKETVAEGKTGLLFGPDDDAEMKSKITKLLDDPGRASGLGAAARAEAVKRFSLEAVAERYLEVYRD